jgi:hypothetical protein
MKLLQYQAKVQPLLPPQAPKTAVAVQANVSLTFVKQTQHKGLSFVPLVQVNTTPTNPLIELPDWNVSASKDRSYITGAVMPQLTSWNERTTPDKWQPGTNQPYFPAKHSEYQYPSFFTDANSLTSKERATPDKWQPNTNQPYLTVTHREFNFPSSFLNSFPRPNGEISTMDKWFKATEEPFFPTPHREYMTTGHMELSSAQRPERITLDKWFKNNEQPYFQTARINTTHQLVDVSPESPETLTTDWLQTQSQPLNKTPFFQQPGAAFIKAPPEVITTDKWFRNTEQPYFPVKQPLQKTEQTMWVAPPFNPGNLASFFQNTQQYVYPLKTYAYFPYFSFPQNKYPFRYIDKYTTQNSSYANKYMTQGSAYSDKYTTRSSTYNDKYV